MDKKIGVIGAGPAGVFTILELLKQNISGNLITLVEAGRDPWNREEGGGEGFMGQAFGNNVLVATDLGHTSGLVNYGAKEDLETLLEEVQQIISTYTTSTAQQGYLSLTREEYIEFSKNVWIELYRAGVRMLNGTAVTNFNTNHPVVYVDKEEEIFDTLILATGKLGYEQIHSYGELHNVELIQPPFPTQGTEVRDNIPTQYLELGYDRHIKLPATMNFPQMPYLYVVGDVLHQNCIATAAAQGVLAARNLIKTL